MKFLEEKVYCRRSTINYFTDSLELPTWTFLGFLPSKTFLTIPALTATEFSSKLFSGILLEIPPDVSQEIPLEAAPVLSPWVLAVPVLFQITCSWDYLEVSSGTSLTARGGIFFLEMFLGIASIIPAWCSRFSYNLIRNFCR